MRKEIEFFDVYHETLDKLGGEGILLVAGDPPNPMTIGWGTLGTIWHRKIMTVMVRPTRFTYDKMESISDFSVCVMPEGCSKELSLCGTRSGRDLDKMAACGFHVEKGIHTNSFFIAESDYHFECRIVHKHFIDPFRLDSDIIDRFYPLRDFHMVYYGEIRGIFKRT
jgi:flavin reductase (DIM6/NTAB) family NADH-FMN oxidoreductase RutF